LDVAKFQTFRFKTTFFPDFSLKSSEKFFQVMLIELIEHLLQVIKEIIFAVPFLT
jgi:hypothetical protein